MEYSVKMKEYAKEPVFFDTNRVYRVYTGGKLLDQFCGNIGNDTNFPEEWIASTVHAANNENAAPKDGLSKLEHTDITLKELLEQYPAEFLGPNGNWNILVKYLDSSIRLPIQAHPDKAFSRKYFHSEFGKTEMWLILATREEANICFGFRKRMTKEQFMELERRSRTEKNIMDSYMNRKYVKPGEVYLIPARAVHAIGAGCLILEVQEPTDFTISPEFWCKDHLLSDQEMYMGLDREDALDCFDYAISGQESIRLAEKEPALIEKTEKWKMESLITRKDTPCFEVLRLTVLEDVLMMYGPAIYIVTKGQGRIEGETYQRKIKQGTYFFLPYLSREKFSIQAEENETLEVIICIPPVF